MDTLRFVALGAGAVLGLWAAYQVLGFMLCAFVERLVKRAMDDNTQEGHRAIVDWHDCWNNSSDIKLLTERVTAIEKGVAETITETEAMRDD